MPYSSEFHSRLSRGVANDRKKLEPFRKNRRDAIREMVGAFYSGNGTQEPVPINLIELFVRTYTSLLTPQAPKCLITTTHKRLKAEAVEYQLALDHLANEIRLGETLERWVLDALFGLSILDVSMHVGSQIEHDGFLHDVGQPHADVISLDDFFMDMSAKRIDKAHYFGHDYQWRRQDLMQISWVDKDKVQKLPTDGWDFSGSALDSVAEISRGQEAKEGSLYEMVSLADAWLPFEGKILTYATGGSSKYGADGLGECVGERDWYGVESGRYKFLSLGTVPDQNMPLPPVAIGRAMHNDINFLFLKAQRQAGRQKDNTLYSGSAAEDAKRQKDAVDGETILCNDPNKVVKIRTPGPSPENLAFVNMETERASWLWGNLEALAGLAPQSETARGEQLIHEAANVRVGPLRRTTIGKVGEVFDALAWYLRYDPLIEVPIVKRIPGSDIEIEKLFVPADMEGDYWEYNYAMDIYSATEQTPGTRLNSLKMVLGELIFPQMQSLGEQGMAINWEALVQVVGRYSGTEADLQEILMYSGTSQRPGPVGEPPRKAPNTTRTYTHQSRPTPPNRLAESNNAIQNLMAGAGAPQNPGAYA